MTAQEIIKAFSKTKWWQPTVYRYRQHVETCERLECTALIEPFLKFVDEVMNTPEENRDGLLAVTELEPYVAFQHFRQYSSPIASEVLAGLTAGRQPTRKYDSKKK